MALQNSPSELTHTFSTLSVILVATGMFGVLIYVGLPKVDFRAAQSTATPAQDTTEVRMTLGLLPRGPAAPSALGVDSAEIPDLLTTVVSAPHAAPVELREVRAKAQAAPTKTILGLEISLPAGWQVVESGDRAGFLIDGRSVGSVEAVSASFTDLAMVRQQLARSANVTNLEAVVVSGKLSLRYRVNDVESAAILENRRVYYITDGTGSQIISAFRITN